MPDVSEEIVRYFGDGNIVNIQFVPFDEKQKQVKRPLELGQLYGVCRGSGGQVWICYRLIYDAVDKAEISPN